jgi:hypothetical protein
MPTRVEANGIERYPPEVEATVYFCFLEALQNKRVEGVHRGAPRIGPRRP